MSKKFYKRTLEWLLLIFVIAIAVKIAQQTILPEKYFYDSQKILLLMTGFYDADGVYLITADIFNSINIFNFDSLLEWSIALGIIFNIIVFFILLTRNKKYTLTQYIFIYASIALLNIYVFNLSKDIIQFVVFLIIYKIIINSKKSNLKKVVLIALVLIIEALTYRIYYGIMAMILITIYGIYMLFIKNKSLNKKTMQKILIISLIVFFLEVFIVSFISSDNYTSILYARSSVNIYREDDTDAVTIINDWFGENTNFVKFIGNYSVNFIRMAFPIELVLKGVKYIPFIIYQIYVSITCIKLLKKASHKNIVLIATYLSFFMVSVIFEPDFGSWIRHESAIMLIIIEMTKNIDTIDETVTETAKNNKEIGENNVVWKK